MTVAATSQSREGATTKPTTIAATSQSRESASVSRRGRPQAGTEQFLRITKATGMAVGQRVESALLIDGYGRHVATLARSVAEEDLADGEASGDLLAENGCPELGTFLRAPEPTEPDFGLDRILDGIQSYLEKGGIPAA
jgi:hypothetical protein